MLYNKDTIKYEQIKSISLKDKISLKNLLDLFNIPSLCKKNGMLKHKGYPISDILELLFLFPFMTRRMAGTSTRIGWATERSSARG